MDINSNEIMCGSAVFLTILGGVAWASWSMVKFTKKFYTEADRIERMIKTDATDATQKVVVAAIIALSKESFHRETSHRITELAKMAEVKYGIHILKINT